MAWQDGMAPGTEAHSLRTEKLMAVQAGGPVTQIPSAPGPGEEPRPQPRAEYAQPAKSQALLSSARVPVSFLGKRGLRCCTSTGVSKQKYQRSEP